MMECPYRAKTWLPICITMVRLHIQAEKVLAGLKKYVVPPVGSQPATAA